MTSTDRRRYQPRELMRSARLALLLVAVAAWIVTIFLARSMGNGPGTMGLGPVQFLGVWAVMMAAMMLPIVQRELPDVHNRNERRPATGTIGFVAGYLAVWAVAGIAVYSLAVVGNHLAEHGSAGAVAAAVVFAICGLYQFSSAKSRALAWCGRSDHDSNVAIGAATKPTVRGLMHGYWCYRSSWPQMALLVPFGIMNMTAMVAISAALFVERATPSGPRVSRVIGLVSLLLGPLVLIDPGVAPGLHRASMGPLM